MEKYRPFTPFAFNVSCRPTRAFLTSSSKRIAMNMRAIIVSVCVVYSIPFHNIPSCTSLSNRVDT